MKRTNISHVFFDTVRMQIVNGASPSRNLVIIMTLKDVMLMCFH